MSEYFRPEVDLDDSWSGQPALKVLCPICMDPYQHHSDVLVFERPMGEDGPTMMFAPGKTGVETRNNPSPRRDAVRVVFRGECGHEWSLEIVQHKGETFAFAKYGDD